MAQAAPAPAPNPDLSEEEPSRAPGRVGAPGVPASRIVRVTSTPHFHVKRGQAYEDEGLLDRALEEYTQAILLQPNTAEAYLGRGWVHHAKGSRRLAVKNFSQAIRLNPRNPEAYFGRAWAYEQLGQVDLAIKEYGQAIALKDDYADAYLSRGVLRFYHDRPEAAAADFSTVLDKAPDGLRRYALLWLFLSRARSGGDGAKELSKLAESVSLTPWPGIIVTHYLGKAGAEQVLRAITDDDRRSRLEKECVAYFFLGQYDLVRGDRKRAAEHFRKTLAIGVTGYRQYGAAEKELRRMGETP
ncbi:MAG: tetratricopeptide repeat protein [Rhodospirillales bacterium]|jgi:lipoprotein NlpI|nr:tetratricopeptide repeat protein [Rhodospirillales bacterium]